LIFSAGKDLGDVGGYMKRKKYFIFIGLLSLGAVTFLAGCSTILLFNPKGPIGESERFLILVAIGLMAIVVIPVFIMAFWFPRKYRASNTSSTYMPKWSYSAKIDMVMWGVPIAIVTVLAILTWGRTFALDPYKPIPSAHKPVNIQAVSLNWKWLFIYPDQNIATVNQITFPANVPLSFKLTSDTVMTSFFIPQLGSQMYAMGGMQTQLNLLADKLGTYAGHNNQISGIGYANMHFKARAVSPEEFQAWVQKVRQSKELLDLKRYKQLTQPNDGYYPVTYFSAVEPDLFLYVLRKYDPTWGEHPSHITRSSAAPHTGTVVTEGN
jgi:cytochrome o ubiquinol oxidase subunit II